LTESAKAAARTKNTYLAAHHAQLRGRRGEPKAIGATRHDILIAYYYIVRDQVPFREQKPRHLGQPAHARGIGLVALGSPASWRHMRTTRRRTKDRSLPAGSHPNGQESPDNASATSANPCPLSIRTSPPEERKRK
jgi:hypothetical protein